MFPAIHGASGEDGSGPEALPPVEICPRGGSYDYAARSTLSDRVPRPGQALCRGVQGGRGAAVTAHRALGLRDISRADLITSAGEAFFLEVNVTPGMTEMSTLPMALDAAVRGLGAACRALLGQAAARGT